MATREQIQTRIEALKDAKFSSIKATGNPNGQKELERILDELDEDSLALIEAEDSAHQLDKSFKDDLSKAVKDIAFGTKVIATLSLLNRRNNITRVQSAAIMSNVSVQQIVGLLQIGAINDALPAIEGLDLTGLEPLTETERSLIVAEIEAYIA